MIELRVRREWNGPRSSRRHLRMLRLLAICAGLDRAASGSMGAAECPCLQPGTPRAYAIQSVLLAHGYPATYGLSGCAKYDLGLNLSGCSGNTSKIWCGRPWCYVDNDACTINETACNEAQGLVGSAGIPACRTRTVGTTSKPAFLPASVGTWSYTTCGSVDLYSSDIIMPIAGHNLVVAVDDFPGVIEKGLLDPERPELQGYRGVLATFMYYVLVQGDPEQRLAYYTPVPNITFVSQFGSNLSRHIYPTSSYTACVLDVDIGLVDMCWSLFWITNSRQKLTPFTPPFMSDEFYLVVNPTVPELTLRQQLQKPFEPFSLEVWMLVGAFIAFHAMAMVATDYNSDEDFPFKGPWYVVIWMKVAKSLWLSMMGFLYAPPDFHTSTLSSKVSMMGFNFFSLIVISSYTANLAAILVSQGQNTLVTSVDDAINRGYEVCMDPLVKPIFSETYPQATVVTPPSSDEVPFWIHSNQCSAGLMTASDIQRMHAGVIYLQDCSDLIVGSSEYFSRRCERGESRDCVLQRVGPLVLSLAVAIPVRKEIAHSLSWSMVRAIEAGLWELAISESKGNWPPPAICDSAPDEEPVGMPLESMYGTLILTAALLSVGLFLHILKLIFLGPVYRILAKRGFPHLPSGLVEGMPHWASAVIAKLNETREILERLTRQRIGRQEDEVPKRRVAFL